MKFAVEQSIASDNANSIFLHELVVNNVILGSHQLFADALIKSFSENDNQPVKLTDIAKNLTGDDFKSRYRSRDKLIEIQAIKLNSNGVYELKKLSKSTILALSSELKKNKNKTIVKTKINRTDIELITEDDQNTTIVNFIRKVITQSLPINNKELQIEEDIQLWDENSSSYVNAELVLRGAGTDKHIVSLMDVDVVSQLYYYIFEKMMNNANKNDDFEFNLPISFLEKELFNKRSGVYRENIRELIDQIANTSFHIKINADIDTSTNLLRKLRFIPSDTTANEVMFNLITINSANSADKNGDINYTLDQPVLNIIKEEVNIRNNRLVFENSPLPLQQPTTLFLPRMKLMVNNNVTSFYILLREKLFNENFKNKVIQLDDIDVLKRRVDVIQGISMVNEHIDMIKTYIRNDKCLILKYPKQIYISTKQELKYDEIILLVDKFLVKIQNKNRGNLTVRSKVNYQKYSITAVHINKLSTIDGLSALAYIDQFLEELTHRISQVRQGKKLVDHDKGFKAVFDNIEPKYINKIESLFDIQEANIIEMKVPGSK
jgi:hypothetical protein